MIYSKDAVVRQNEFKQLGILAERMKDQREYLIELKRIQDEISFEADRIRQGGLAVSMEDDEEALEDELLRLRQLKDVQSKQIKTYDEDNKILTQTVEKLRV